MFKIKTLNAISDVIHEELSAEQYVISPEEPVPEGILVRSAVMHDAPLNPELLGIARAGAGVNNIPLEKCTKQGIAVFNTPGANANAVAELVLGALVLGSRNVADAPPKLLYLPLAYCRARWARPSSRSFSHSCFFPQAGDFASAEASRGQ